MTELERAEWALSAAGFTGQKSDAGFQLWLRGGAMKGFCDSAHIFPRDEVAAALELRLPLSVLPVYLVAELLLDALQARERYEQHVAWCPACAGRTGEDCEERNVLFTEAYGLRSEALARALPGKEKAPG